MIENNAPLFIASLKLKKEKGEESNCKAKGW